MSVRDPSNDSVTTIKPMGRDMFESKSEMEDILIIICTGLELRDVSCKYLYSTDTEINLMDEKSFEEISIPKSLVKEATINLLEDGMSLKVRLAQENPVGLVLPRIIKCTVKEVIESTEGTDKKYIEHIFQCISIMLF